MEANTSRNSPGTAVSQLKAIGDSRMSKMVIAHEQRQWLPSRVALSSAMAGSNDCSMDPRLFRMFLRCVHRRVVELLLAHCEDEQAPGATTSP